MLNLYKKKQATTDNWLTTLLITRVQVSFYFDESSSFFLIRKHVTTIP